MWRFACAAFLWCFLFTVAGARAQPAWPETLTETDGEPYRDWPIVIVDEVRTPAGIILYEADRRRR